MDWLETVTVWVTAREELLSGLAALVVLLGVILTPLSGFVRSFRARRASRKTASAPLPATTQEASAPPLPEEPVIAVLAFDNQSSDADLQYFSEGVSDDIVQILSRGTSLKLIARTSSFQFRGERKANAGKALGCTHLLDGAVRRAAGRIRVNAQLVEVKSGMTLWSDRFEGDLGDIFGVQDQIANQIGTHLHHTFTRLRGYEPPPAVYDLYLRSMLRSYAPDELRGSVGRLEQATREAPDYGAAWGRLAYIRAFHHLYLPYAARPDVTALVRREAGQALNIDPDNADAVAALALIDPPWGSFEEFHQRVERLRSLPRTGDGYRYIGWMLRHFGQVKDALQATESVWLLDPLDPMSGNLAALARMAAGDVERAIPIYEELLQRVPDMSFVLSSLLRALAFKGDWIRLDQLLALANQRQLREFEEGLGFIRAKRHRTEEHIQLWMQRTTDRVLRTGSIDPATLVYMAHLGRVDEAYGFADSRNLGPTGGSEDILGPDAYRPAMLFQAGMPELRRDPRFARLCGRLGLARFWVSSELWPDCVDELPYDLKQACRDSAALAEPWRYPAS